MPRRSRPATSGHRTAVSSHDEIGALALSFNTMAASLETRHRELYEAREAASTEALKRARSENMERQAKETLAAVIDASPVAIVCSDTDRRLVLWSHAAERIFGYTAEEVLGQRTKLIPSHDQKIATGLFDRAISGETVRDLEVKRRHKDGTLIDIRMAATPMYNPDGTAWGVAWAYDDITDRKKAEQQLSHLAHFDQLTGLPNRVVAQQRVGRTGIRSPCRHRVCSISTASRTSMTPSVILPATGCWSRWRSASPAWPRAAARSAGSAETNSF